MTAALITLPLAVCALLLGYLVVCALIAWRFTSARRQRPADMAGSQPVSFAARDGHGGAAGVTACYLPAARPGSAVVFVHGKDACRGDELKSPTHHLAEAFAAAGLSVLMIDLRGHGNSPAARLTYGQRERFDVLGAVDWLRRNGHHRVGVLGASMGAASSLLAAADEPAIEALVADSAFADFGQMMERQFHKLCHLPSWFLPGILALGRLLTGVDMRHVRPLAVARALAGRPLLVIHSQGDRFVPAEDARAIAREATAELWITDTEGHIGSYRGQPELYARRVLGFFVRHLGVLPEVASAQSAV